jgi:prolipoprotein diacylglyceryltransferase
MTYWIFALATALVSGLFFYTAMRRANVPLTAWQVFGVVQVVALFGYLLSRFCTLLEDRLQFGAWPSANTWLSPLFHWYGALLGVAVAWLLALLVFRVENRQAMISFFGVLAQTACIIFFFGKLGCFGDGHTGCVGGPTELPWGVTYSWGSAASAIPLHPNQLYSAAGALLLFLVLRYKVGVAWSAAVFLMVHALMEFSLEFLKPMPRLFFGTFSLAHVSYISVFIIGFIGSLLTVWLRNDLPLSFMERSEVVS